jgi:hypothetical protein
MSAFGLKTDMASRIEKCPLMTHSGRFPLLHAHCASLPEVSVVRCFLSASLSQPAHYAAYLCLYP